MSLSDNNKDGYFAKGIVARCDCGVKNGIVDIELTRDGKLYSELVSCPCGRDHNAQEALDRGEIDTNMPRNYIMTDPDHYSEEIHADCDDLAIAQLIRWAEINGEPYTGRFSLHRCDEYGNTGEIVYEHESERKGRSSMDTKLAKLSAYGYFFDLYRTYDPAKKSPELEIIASNIEDRIMELKSAIALERGRVKDAATHGKDSD